MDWMTFVSTLVTALAWPSTVLALFLLLRGPIRSLLPLVQKLKYREFEVEFGKRVEELQAEVVTELPPSKQREALPPSSEGALAALAAVSPRAAVMEAWRELELAAFDAAARLGPAVGMRVIPTYQAIRYLEHHDGVDRGVISLLRDLRGLRNQAAHAPEFALTTQAALGYAQSAQSVAAYLKGLGGGG